MESIKELRKRNRAGSIDGAMLPDSQSDQVISANKLDGDMKVRAPGPGLKLQAPSDKHQASSCKPQAPSFKLQAC